MLRMRGHFLYTGDRAYPKHRSREILNNCCISLVLGLECHGQELHPMNVLSHDMEVAMSIYTLLCIVAAFSSALQQHSSMPQVHH